MSLDEIRDRIDMIDDKIAELFVQRMDCAKEIAFEKAASGLQIANPLREKEIIDRVTNVMPDDVKMYGKQLFEKLFETSRAYQRATMSVRR